MPPEVTLSETAWSECESVIRRFEAAWRDQQRPDVNAYLIDSPHQTRLLVELVHVDLEFRLRNGEDVRVESYFSRYPALGVAPLAVDLITAEFALRNRYGVGASRAEFWLRFPEHLRELRSLLHADGDLDATRRGGPSDAPRAGTPTIAGYEIVGELGRGGMGVVYRARDLLLQRIVAIKTLAAIPGPDTGARFAREAEAIARLDHSHIVPVYEVGEWRSPAAAAPIPYFAMKWYAGGSLDAGTYGPGTDVAAHARTVELIARAVHHAHQRGVLHRDLKPSNILLDDAGQPHVADFGLAGRFDPSDPRTLTAAVVGTPAYMAPEQALTPQQVTTAVDVYGLGAVLYHQLTGREPFRADTALATLDLVVNEPPIRPTALNPDVPRDLETIALKCLEKDPEQRYASAEALAADLERFRTGRPIQARPTPAAERAWRWVRRHPWIAGLSAATFAALVFAVVALAVGNARVREKERETAAAFEREATMRSELEEALLREKQALYLERVSSAGRLYAANQLPSAWALLDACPPEFRHWEWRYLDSLRRGSAIDLIGHTAWVAATAFLPDGRLVSLDTQGHVRVWDVANRTEQRTWRSGPGPASVLSIHPTRNWIAVGGSTGPTVWNADTGELVTRLPGSGWVAFTPDGAHIAYALGNDVKLRSITDWQPAGGFSGHADVVVAFDFTPDGKHLATCSLDRTVRTWNCTTKAELRRRDVPIPVARVTFVGGGRVLAEGHFGSLVFTDFATGELLDRIDSPVNERSAVVAGPDDNTVGLYGPNGEVVIRDLKRRRTVRVYRGHAARISAMAFGPKNFLAAAGGDQVVRVWDMANEPEARTIAWVGRGVGGLSVSSDGSRVAVGPRQIGPDGETAVLVFDTASGREIDRFAGLPDVEFQPGCRRLAAGRYYGGALLRDIDAGRELWSHSFPHPSGRNMVAVPGGRRIAFSPDGTTFANWESRSRGVQLWNAADGTDAGLIDLGGALVNALEFTPDGQHLLVSAHDGTTRWAVATRTRVPWSDSVPTTYALAFNANGTMLITLERGPVIRIRNAATGALVREFVGDTRRVTSLALNRDGTRLVTGGSDHAVRIWDVESGRELLALPGANEAVTSVVWDRTGDRIFALDDAIRAWEPARR